MAASSGSEGGSISCKSTVPVGHTPYSWFPHYTTATVPQSHTPYSWASEQPLGPDGAEARVAAIRDGYAVGCYDRRGRSRHHRRRRRKSTSDTNTRLLDPAMAEHLADNAINRCQKRAPSPWRALLQPSQLKRIIIGLGSGRCGTQSLAELFSAQPDCWAKHEMIVRSSMLEWETRKLAGQQCRTVDEAADWRLGRVIDQYNLFLRSGHSTAACVSSSGLAFVHEYLSLDVAGVGPTVRVVVLRRPCEEVVASFVRKTADRNHWQHPDDWEGNDSWQQDKTWDRIFPNMSIAHTDPSEESHNATERVLPVTTWGKQEAIRAYWRLYYTVVDRLISRYPERVRCFEMSDVLGTPQTQREMLEWAGGWRDGSAVVSTNILLNRGVAVATPSKPI